MAKGRHAVVNGTTRKVKKRYAVVGGVTRKIKKRYVVVDGKTRLCWSGSQPLFVATSRYGVITSEDGINWTSQTIVETNSGRSTIRYGNGVFVLQFDKAQKGLIATSVDGKTWTTNIVDSEVAESTYSNFDCQLFFCNGKFIAKYKTAASTSKTYVYTSTDGKTWTKIGTTAYLYAFSVYSDVVYGYFNGSRCYVQAINDGYGKVEIRYSTDLLTWTTYAALCEGAIYNAHVTEDETIYLVCYASSDNPTPFIYNATTRKKVCTFESLTNPFATEGSCYNKESGEIAVIYRNSVQVHFGITENKTTAVKKGYFSHDLGYFKVGGVLYGNDKYVVLRGSSTNVSTIIFTYSIDGGLTWTEVNMGRNDNVWLNSARMTACYAEIE